MKLTRDIQSLSTFKRDTSKFLKQMKRTGQPIILTVNGKAAAVIIDPDDYEQYEREKEHLDTIAGVQRGIADMKAGHVKDAEEVFRKLETRFRPRARS